MGCRARVLCVSGDVDFRRRLLELGFCNEACIEVVGRAPFGDPVEYRLRGYNLSLRSEQAKNVLVALQSI